MPSRLVKPPATERLGAHAPRRGPLLRPIPRWAARLGLVLAALWLWSAAQVAHATALPTRPIAAKSTVSTATLSFGAIGGRFALAPPAPPPAEPDLDADEPEQPDTEPKAAAKVEVVAPKLQRKRSIPPFWIYREYDTHTTRAVPFPPLFVHRTPKADHPEKLLHADLSFTFGWYSKSTGRRRWMNPLALFFGGYSERKTVWGAVPLLMGYRRVGEQFNFGQFPFVWWWGTKYVKNLFVVPFHYHQKRPDGRNAISGLLFWYGHKNLDDTDLENDRRHFVAAPIFYRFQRGLKRFDFAFLYIGGENKIDGRKYAAALPFVFWQQSEFGNRRELWTIPFVRRTDTARRRSAWALPPLLTFHSKTPDRSIFSATPLVWRTKNRLRGSTFTYAALFGLYDDPRQRNNFFAPLWWQFTDKTTRSTTSILAPLGFARRTPDRTAVWTLLGGGARGKNNSWAVALPPLLTFLGRNEQGKSWQGLLGAFWHVRNPKWGDGKGRDTGVLGPIAFWDRKGSFTHAGLPLALTFAGWSATKHYQVITPLFWHVRDRDPAKDRRTIVLAPWYHHKTKHGFEGGLAPLGFWGSTDKRRYGVVPPLLFAHVTDVKEDRHLTISPIFARSKGPDHRTLGVGLIAWDVLRKNEHHTAVFPIFYRRRVGDRTLTLTPIGAGYRTADKLTHVYGPVYRFDWRNREAGDRKGFGVLPLLYHDVRRGPKGTTASTVLFPLFARHRQPEYDIDMWSPLLWRTHVRGEKPRRNFAIVPLYFQQRQPHGVDVDAGLGFFWSRDRDRRTHTIIAGPAFHRLSRKSINAGVFPIYWWLDSSEKRRLLSLPLIFHFEDKLKNEHTTVAVPLWFDRRRANGRRTWAAFPFVFGGKRLYNFTRFSLAPPGYVDVFRLNRNARFTGFVPLLFRYQKCGFRKEDDPRCRYTLWGSAPLFLYGRDGQGRVTHGAALLYYWDRKKDGYKLYTPLFGINNKPGKTLGFYAGGPLLAVKLTNTHRRVMVFPLYYRRALRPELRRNGKAERQSLTLVAPPLFVMRERKDRRFFEAGLLVWQFRQQHKVSTAIVPPIFFLSEAYAQRRLYWFAPLFLRDNHIAQDKTWTAIAPALYVQHRNGENLDFVQFPLVWHIERGPNQGTFGAFVWWDIRTKGNMLQFVPALFTRWNTPERDTKVAGPGLGWWWRGKGVNEGERGWRALFGAFGGGVSQGRRYISIFGGRIDRGPASPAAAPKKAARTERQQTRRLQRAEARVERLERATAQGRPGAERRLARARESLAGLQGRAKATASRRP